MLRSYKRSWLRADLVAGVVLAAILVPQGMAYAELAGLPPVNGLYTTIACLVGYALMGPSKILVLGPDSSLGPLILAAITPLVVAGDDPVDRHRAGRDAGDPRRSDRDRSRCRQARFRRRPALQRGPGRLHERLGHHHHRGSAPEAVRVLHGRRHLRGGGAGVRDELRPAQLHGPRRGSRHPRRAARAAPPHAKAPCRPGGRGRGDRRHGRLRLRHQRRSARCPKDCPGRPCRGRTSATSGRCSWRRWASRLSR